VCIFCTKAARNAVDQMIINMPVIAAMPPKPS
jgi:hypothetical protein